MTSPGSGSVMAPSGKVCVSGLGRLLMVVFREETEGNSRGRNCAAKIFAARVPYGACFSVVCRCVVCRGVYPSRRRVLGREC